MHAAYYGGGDFSDDTLAALRKYIPRLDDPATQGRFYPDWVVKDHYALDGLATGEFVAMYADSFMRNPFKMVKSMLYRNRAYWVIDPKSPINGVNYTDIYDPSTDSYGAQAPDIGAYRQPSAFTALLDKYSSIMASPLPSVLFWRFGVWTALMVVAMASLLARGMPVRLIVFVPVCVYVASLLIAGGWTDYRYGLPVFFAGLFLPPALILPSKDAL
jgi:hypothetical protein